MKRARGTSVWDGHFDEASRTLGDTEAANSYLSVRNFFMVRSAVLDLVGETRDARVLDVGCGTGHFAQPLAATNRVIGADLSNGMLRFAAVKGLAPVRASGLELPFESGGFDIVLAASILQLIRDGGAFVRELVRVTRPGGRIIAATINARNAAVAVLRVLERRKYRHFRLYPYEELRDLAREAGAEIRRAVFVYYPFGRTKTVSGGRRPGFSNARFASSLVVEAVKR